MLSLIDMIRMAERVYLIGNGGSYANAQHICNDLLSSGVRAYTLDPATMAAWANDYGWETVFSRWLAIVGEPGDLLIAMSGSGKSQNILNAIAQANHIGMAVYKIFGNERNEDMQLAEEQQLVIGHLVAGCLQPTTS